jgi:hypothetical protein
MKERIQIITKTKTLDAEGFAIEGETVIASVRAYKEDRSSTEKWANRAVYSAASSLFRFRSIPHVTITTAHYIICENIRYNILSAEDVRGKGMYWEILAERVEAVG